MSSNAGRGAIARTKTSSASQGGTGGSSTARSRARRTVAVSDAGALEGGESRKEVNPRPPGTRSKPVADKYDRHKPSAPGSSSALKITREQSGSGSKGVHIDLPGTEECHEDSDDCGEKPMASVEYSMNTAEVVVQGENVTKISVKFPPHPPDDSSRQSSASRQRSITSRTSSRMETQHHIKNESLPYPMEESSSQSDDLTKQIVHYNFPQLTASAEPEGVCSDTAHVRSSQDSAFHSSSMSLSGLDMDSKFKQDMLHSIEYFDRRNSDLKQVNSKMAKENERLREANKHLEDYINDLSKRYDVLNDDHNELKVKHDQIEKENSVMKEESVSRWEAKVKADEMYMELQRDSSKEIKSLQEQLARRNIEGSSVIRTETQRRRSSVVALTDSREDMAEKLELVHKIAQLENEIKKLKLDQEKSNRINEETKEELNDLQCLYRQKTTELEAQYKRFLSLKKSFNALMEENETIKKQFRERKELINSTWPINKPTTLIGKRNESVAFIDLGSQSKSSNSTAFPKVDTRNKLAVTTTRPRTENLPPV